MYYVYYFYYVVVFIVFIVFIKIYDTRSGGLGASAALYQRTKEVLSRARELVRGCACAGANGCPSCILCAR